MVIPDGQTIYQLGGPLKLQIFLARYDMIIDIIRLTYIQSRGTVPRLWTKNSRTHKYYDLLTSSIFVL